MARFKVNVPLLNVRKAPVADFSTQNIITTVSYGLVLDLTEEPNVPNPVLGKWYKDIQGQYYWEKGLIPEIFENHQPSHLFDELTDSEQYRFAEDFIENNFEKIKNEYPEITGMFVGKKNVNGIQSNIVSIVFQVSQKTDSTNQFPKIVEFDSYRIPTDVEEADISIPHTASIASGISRKGDMEYGTLGIPILKNGKLYYMSCYHVYCNQELRSGTYEVSYDHNNPSLISPCEQDLNGNPSTIAGQLIEGQLSEYLDIAIMEPKVPISNKYTDFDGPIYYRVLKRSYENNMFLQFKGNGSKTLKNGKLVNIYVNKYFDYKGKKNHLLKGLIQIEKCALGGDSGSAVCDFNGYFIGYIVGSDNKYTYIISAYTILNNTNYTFNSNT